MSIKDYKAIVSCLRKCFPSKMSRNQNFLDLIDNLCVTFKADNPKFNENKFRRAL